MVVTGVKERWGLFTFDFVTSATPSAVFDYVMDFPRHAEWETGVEEVGQDDPGAIAVGTRFEAYGAPPVRGWRRLFHERSSTTWKVVRIERDQLVSWQEIRYKSEDSDHVEVTTVHIAALAGHGAKVTVSHDFFHQGAVARWWRQLLEDLGAERLIEASLGRAIDPLAQGKAHEYWARVERLEAALGREAARTPVGGDSAVR